MQHALLREKCSQLGVGDAGKSDMFYGAVQIKQHGPEGQKYSKLRECRRENVRNLAGITTGTISVHL